LNDLSLQQLPNELRRHVIGVAHDAKVGNAENRGIFVLVNGGDDFGAPDAGDVLDLPGNTGTEIEIRLDLYAGSSRTEPSLPSWAAAGSKVRGIRIS
jgi:hypothetical protein